MSEQQLDLLAVIKQACEDDDEAKCGVFELAIKHLTRGQRFYMRGVYDAACGRETCEINGREDEYKAGYQAGTGVRLL